MTRLSLGELLGRLPNREVVRPATRQILLRLARDLDSGLFVDAWHPRSLLRFDGAARGRLRGGRNDLAWCELVPP